MIQYSIIIPCYNSELFIGNCINGLLELSFDKKKFEVIFVDDCSTDNTVETIINATDNTGLQIRIIKNNHNSGPGASRRYAANIANGDYLCFCDSDDWYEPCILTDLDNEIKKEHNDIVIFDMSYLLGNQKIQKNYTAQFIYGNKSSYLLNCAESLCNLAVRRSLFLSVPQIDIRNGEDLAIVPLLIANATKITHINKSYYNYVMRGNSASLDTPNKGAYRNMMLAFDHINKNLKTDIENIYSYVEFIGIKTVLYNSTLMAIKGRNSNHIISEIVSDFSKSYPSWHLNPNNHTLNVTKRIYLWLIQHKIWILCRAFAMLHSYILTRNHDI